MRLLVFFDLPVKTLKERRIYTRFRSFLLKDGYDMMQFSVYSRLCLGQDLADKHLARLEKQVPSNGSVRSLCITDKQFARMRLWVGEPTPKEKKISPQQLVLL